MKRKPIILVGFLLIIVISGLVINQVTVNRVLPLSAKDISYIEIREMNKNNPKEITIQYDADIQSQTTIENIVYALNQLTLDTEKNSFNKEDAIYDITFYMNNGSIFSATLTNAVVRLKSSCIERYLASDIIIKACKDAVDFETVN